mgnify:CR=1 FL=1
MICSLIFFLSSVLPTVHASDACSQTRMDGPGGSMEHVPVRDQGQFGNCYAHAAAQMYDAWRFSHGDQRFDHPSSGLMAAISYVESVNAEKVKANHAEDQKKNIDGGYACNVINSMKTCGSCDESVCISKTEGRAQFTEFYKTMTDSMNLNDRVMSRRSSQSDVHHWVRSDVCASLGKGGLQANAQFLERIESTILKGNTIEVLSAFKNQVCSASNQINLDRIDKIKPCTEGFRENGTMTATAIHGLLTKNNAQPVAVVFCGKLLKNGRGFRGLQYMQEESKVIDSDSDGKNCGPHQALIIGQRRNPMTYRCEFLIRNSWGTDAKYPKWEKDTEGVGNVWVDGHDLMENTANFSSLPPD